jgi:hypothetical protein
VVVLDGTKKKRVDRMGEDIFRYFGLGCRQRFQAVPKGYSFDSFEAIFAYQDVIHYENMLIIMIIIKQFFNE